MVKRVYILTNQLPDSEKYGLRSQVNRASVSIPSNIAEGCGRCSDKDLQRFLSISLGSAFELETQLLLMMELYHIPETDNALAEVKEVQRMISGYSKYLSVKT
ncbi:four helix bundle protein [Membranicola marinus]|uniref:Four helix bundle protein n=1 Tax=Membranihabitans marinus TaxID=1227546 RepID=A0A953L9C8_9BACT|nr:four helix bundle protein [Membranihabitans marinus]